MSKKILVTSTDLMMVQFLVPHIINLSNNGFVVDIACSDVGNRMDEIRAKLDSYVNKIHIVRLHRSPLSIDNFNGYRDMKKLINSNHYDIIWTNEPVMGVVTRLAAKKSRSKGTKVIYMVHGFHFYDNAPKLNWLIYYPIEKLMAPKADMIVTVNQEDYKRAQNMRAKEVKYIHGIGINTSRLSTKNDKTDIRKELDLKPEDFMVLSVGELNENKNQKTIIKAIAKINDESVHYLLCGKGDQLENLKQLADELKIADNVHFLGYRKDVVDICSQADIFVMPSYREGLPVASLEAMYCGLPLVTSNIRGLNDIMEDGVTGYMCKPDDYEDFADKIAVLKSNDTLRKSAAVKNREIVIPYCIENTMNEVLNLFR